MSQGTGTANKRIPLLFVLKGKEETSIKNSTNWICKVKKTAIHIDWSLFLWHEIKLIESLFGLSVIV